MVREWREVPCIKGKYGLRGLWAMVGMCSKLCRLLTVTGSTKIVSLWSWGPGATTLSHHNWSDIIIISDQLSNKASCSIISVFLTDLGSGCCCRHRTKLSDSWGPGSGGQSTGGAVVLCVRLSILEPDTFSSQSSPSVKGATSSWRQYRNHTASEEAREHKEVNAESNVTLLTPNPCLYGQWVQAVTARLDWGRRHKGSKINNNLLNSRTNMEKSIKEWRLGRTVLSK